MDETTTTLAGLAARLDALEAENRSLRAELDGLRRPPGPDPAPAGPVGRRQALRAGRPAAGAAAAPVVASDAAPAAAANGSNLVIGQTNNTGTLPTRLQVTGNQPQYGFAVVDNTPAPGYESFAPAVVGHARGTAFFCGVRGFGEGPQLGVYGESVTNVGVLAASGSGTALVAESETGGALELESPRYHLLLKGTATAPVLTTTAHTSGEILRDAGGSLWLCVASGSPGTWRKLGGATTAGSLHLLPAPVRVYDSRPNSLPAQGPKTPLPEGNVARTIDLKVNGSGVPAGATGVLLTVLLLNATAGAGNATVWANDEPKPSATTLVWGGDAGRFTTMAVSAVDAQARVKVDASLQTHVALDVVGYYR